MPAAKSARPAAKSAGKSSAKSRRQSVRPELVARAWAAQLDTKRPGLIPFVLDRLAEVTGRPVWQHRLDPVSELILTILTANSADINAEVAFGALRDEYPSAPHTQGRLAEPRHFPGWGGVGLPDLPPPDWAAVEAAPIAELTDVIRPGGLANQKAPRIQAALRALAANGGLLAGVPARQCPRWRPATGCRPSRASARRPLRWCCSSASGRR
jgi:hypothetical protein